MASSGPGTGRARASKMMHALHLVAIAYACYFALLTVGFCVPILPIWKILFFTAVLVSTTVVPAIFMIEQESSKDAQVCWPSAICWMYAEK